jgi:M6 family metalloprotease-like protein
MPFCFFLFVFCYFVPPSDAAETWRILAVRVSFPLEDPDDETTSGNGTFDLRPFDEVSENYTFPYGIPPHNRSYFEAHLQSLSNYYRDVSGGELEITFSVFPRDPLVSYQLTEPLKAYGNGRTRQEVAERITKLFEDGIKAADLAEDGNLDFGAYDAFAVFHAGLGAEAGQQAPNDIPSAFINLDDLNTFASGPILTNNGTTRVSSGMLLPEAISTDGRGGLNGTLVRFFANQLGVPALSNFEDDLPAVGDWSPMDTGGPSNFSSAARLGLQALTGDPADSILIGFIPSRMLAWTRIQLGWLDPLVVTRSDTVQIIAPHIDSDLPQAVKVPLSATEYFLIENRLSRLKVHGRKPQIEISNGVWVSTDDYDSFIPGSGILIWHIDDTVIQDSDPDNPINSNSKYRISSGQYRRGVSLEEADGLEDIGNLSADRVVQAGIISLDDIEGGSEDPYYLGGTTLFGPETMPNSNSNLRYRTGITIETLSPPGDTMSVAIRFSVQPPGWPVSGRPSNGKISPRAIDLDGDGIKEILRHSSNPSVFTAIAIDGSTREFNVGLSGGFTPSIGNLVDESDQNGEEWIFGGGETLTMGLEGVPTTAGADWTVFPPPVISAPPVLASFPFDKQNDIWGWSHGEIVWGSFSAQYGGQAGSAALGNTAIKGIAVADLDGDTDIELVVLDEAGHVYVVDGPETFRQLGTVQGRTVGSPVAADLDADGSDEAVILSSDGSLSIFRSSGLAVESAPVQGGAGSGPVLGDFNLDGFIDILFGGLDRVWVVQFNGIIQSDTPLALPLKDQPGLIESPPLMADLDLDGSLEILVSTKGGLIYALDRTGENLEGFPLNTNGPISSTPLLDDLDGDGSLELVAFEANGSSHLWRLESINPQISGSSIIWGQEGGGAANTGRLSMRTEGVAQDTTGALLPSHLVYCYPNPIRSPLAKIRFFLGGNASIHVTVLNALGEIVDRMSLENPTPRVDNELTWDTTTYSSGLYICRVEARSPNQTEVRFIKAAVIR